MSTEVCPPPSPCEIARKRPLLQGSYFSFQAEGSLSIARFSTNIFDIFLQLSLACIGSPLFSVRAESIPSQHRVRHAQLKAKLFASWFSLAHWKQQEGFSLDFRVITSHSCTCSLIVSSPLLRPLIIYSFPKTLAGMPEI